MEEQKIKTIKGFDHNLQCRGKQYEVGQTYTEEGKPEVCEHGMHAISPEASPLSVFSYYPPSDNGKPSRYCEVEASGDIASDGEKIAASKLTVGAEIGIPGLVKAHVEWVRQHITNEHNAEPGKPATAGDGGAATAGYGGAATAGYGGAATAGDGGAATAGDGGAATAGDGGAATAGDRGAATAGYRGAATAGYRGAATAGDGGAATAGYRGAATAGYGGAATAGYGGAATAGYGGAATAGDGGAATAGYRGAATAGDGGAATAGYGGAATAGYRGAATSRGSSAVEENGVAVARGNYIKVKGGIGSLLVIAKEYSNTYDIKEWKAAIVDGETIKADTWYTVENGKWIEVTE